MKKLLVKGPALSLSGYGEQARFALRSLTEREDIDLYLLNIPWGRTGQILDSSEKQWLMELIKKTEIYFQQFGGKPFFDISLQVTIPNEFQKIAEIDIGYTAGIETTKVSPQWIDKSNKMSKIIVPSKHSKNVFEQTIYKAVVENTGKEVEFKLTKPVEVCAFPAREMQYVVPELNLSTNWNFLSVAQWGVRKNVEATISNFLKEFRNEEVGLVLKLNMSKNSTMDKLYTREKLKNFVDNIKNQNENTKCKVYLLHGSMTDEEVRGLYHHPKIKAFVTTTHGEGFGLPMFDAAIAGLPIIAPAWSSYVDFLYATKKVKEGKEKMKPHFTKIDFDLQRVQKEAVWDGVIQADSQWCFVKDHSVRSSMREVFKNYGPKLSDAKKLSKFVLENFEEQKQKELLSNLFCKKKILVPEDIEGITFCISTNGAKIEKTLVEIASIKQTMNKVSVPYEIILSGDVEAFSSDTDLILVETPEDAHNGLLAKLRNSAAENAKYDTLVFCDDDLVFDIEWATRLVQFSNTNPWEVLGNKILLPDGGRYWDRATINPHTMIEYDEVNPVGTLYQTGCFWIVRKKVYDLHKWDSSIGYYAEKNGGLNEDVEYSLRLQRNGYYLSFDKENLVIHNDDSYEQIGNICVKNKPEIGH